MQVVDCQTGSKLGDIVRLKGIHFNETTSKQFEECDMGEMTKDTGKKLHTTQYTIKKDIFDEGTTLKSHSLVKLVQFHSKKRFIPVADNPLMRSYPFGYKLE